MKNSPSPNKIICRFLLLIVVATVAAVSLRATDLPETLPLDQVKPGMVGEARTIFSGDQIEKFDLVVIGVLPNLIGPKQSIILVQLKGPKVEHTGVVAGMSGSPVYIDGKLVGALSLKFGVFAKEPLAGVTPIADMLALPTGDSQPSSPSGGSPKRGSVVYADNWNLGSEATSAPQRYPVPDNWAQAAGVAGGGAYLEPIAAPLTFSGFAPAAIRQYAGDWLSYGMVAAPGGVVGPQPDDAKIVAGDMVSMILVQGDLSISVACSVTAITEDRVYMCGHPVFGFGASTMPMARGRTLATLASDYESTKIVNAGGVIGTITQDRVTAVMGRLGAKPAMIPVDLSVASPGGEKQFNIQMISDPKLTPLLVGLVAFNGLTQNTAYGEGTTLRLSGTIDIDGHSPVSLQNMYAPTDLFSPDGSMVSAGVQAVFMRIFSNPYETPKINSVKLRIESLPDRRIARIEDAWAETSEASPGQTVAVKVLLRPYRGAPEIREVPITIPEQATRGTTLRVQISDSESLNRLTSQFESQGHLGSLEQLISLLNRERSNNRLYVTLLKPTPTLLLEDKELPDAPLSELDILNQRPLPGNSMLLRESAAGEWSVPMDEIIAGSSSVFIGIK
jgi:hypothetical protein